MFMLFARQIMPFTLLTVIMLQGCSSRPPAPPKPYADARPWGAVDLNISNASAEDNTILNSLGTLLKQKAIAYSGRPTHVPINILTLSGGGSRGAYGAGFITGWSENGTMPRFDVVTGISTGSIMSTFVFVGGDEIKKVEAFYTALNTEDLYTKNYFSFFSNVAISDPSPLKQLLAREIDDPLLDKVAAEHAKGRRLYVGTTNLDTGRLVVWDMGAIASSGRSDRLERYREVIYASSALPVVFPPQFIALDINKKRYFQMHVDGGIYTFVFMIGLLDEWSGVLEYAENANSDFDVIVYTIANRKYRQRESYDPVNQRPAEVIKALLLTETDLLFDRSMYRLYESVRRKGFKFRMASIPANAEIAFLPYEFDPVEMKPLFDLGRKEGGGDYKWQESIALDEYEKQ